MSKKNITSIFTRLNKSYLTILIAFILGAVCTIIYFDQSHQKTEIETHKLTISACFTPGMDCNNVIIKSIQLAKHEILVQGYSFTSKAIAQALIDAHNRGVRVIVLLDKGNSKTKSGQMNFLVKNGLSVFLEKQKGLAHNKIMIIDNRIVLTGSFNWTNAAQYKNSENLLKINSPTLASQYESNWKKSYRHCKPKPPKFPMN